MLVFGLALTALGASAWWFGHHLLTSETTFWPLDLLSGICVFIGLLFLWMVLYQFRRKLISPTTAELSSLTLDRTRPARLALIQPGPVKWSTLSAHLICVDRHTSMAQRVDGEAYEKVIEKRLHKLPLIEAQKIHVRRGELWHEQREFSLPEGARASTRTRDHEVDLRGIIWTIEVRGKGPFFGSFLHRYDVRVV